MEWFPGGSPTSSELQRILHMSAAKEALHRIKPDVLAAQEIRDWDNFAEVTSILPNLIPLVVSRHRDSPVGGALSIQQIGIASIYPASNGWSEAFKSAPDSPPRGFSFAAIPVDGKNLLIYSVHLKANGRGDMSANIAKREEGARQLLEHLGSMEKIYGRDAVVIICGDFNTDPSDERFVEEKTFPIWEEAGFIWPWAKTPLSERVTLPAKGRYPDACFDGFLVRGDVEIVSCAPITVEGVSDHYPVVLELELQ